MIDTIISDLKREASEKHRMNVIKLGIPETNSLGVPTPFIRKYAKTLKKDDRLARLLWDSGYHEARILSVLVYDALTVTHDDLDRMVADIYSWDLCDHFCKELVIKTPFYTSCLSAWIQESKTYSVRAAFVIMCADIVHNNDIEYETIADYLELCRSYSDNDSLYVKKSISWVMREIGKIDQEWQERVILQCHDLLSSNNRAQLWLAKDVLKEVADLVKVTGRRRLISKHSKMGQQSNQ
ncbi:DNA alkylation repair protein [Erysipelothrix sp. HDW6C]|uniref:DNA alkylation repair protein n=1 Tax=Erysipelothrix sp. HDW6C TaxID=2714930 RepID=UPI00140961CA|nr:DNA alkylation repair protein [Erysipelothrix sp. HDW6C]QIK69501.1 DNA alkylation repair protein [Erysipelothrix sp. HDW6C]